jgi:cytidylate kinase
MQKLIIIRGNSGGGKSTIAVKLQNKMGYKTMLISQDVIRRQILRVQDKPGNVSIQLIYNLALYGMTIGYNVIIEGILRRDIYGDMLLNLIQNFTGSSFVYYFDITLEETIRRHETKQNSHEFGESEMRSWWIEKDYLKVVGEVCITDELHEDETIQLIYQQVGANS